MIIIELEDGRTVKYNEMAYVYRYSSNLVGAVLDKVPAIDVRPRDKIGPDSDVAGIVSRVTLE